MSSTRILVTTNHMRDLAGSETVALEIVEEFLARGWDVDLFTNDLGHPMLGILKGLGPRLRVSTPDDVLASDFAGEYELIWVQHSVLPDALVERAVVEGIRSPMVWHHLSTFLGIEMPRLLEVELRLASVSTAMCEMAMVSIEEHGVPREQISLFENPAPDSFADHPEIERPLSLSKVAVVSNHVPQEVRGAVDELRARGVQVEVIGAHDRPTRVTPALLAGFDAALTIGKTVQFGLSLGLPCFVYDQFGGPGWLNDANFDAERRWAFSGKSTGQRATARQIAVGMITGFPAAQTFAVSRRRALADRWRLSSAIDVLLADDRLTLHEPVKLSPSEARRFRSTGRVIHDYQRRAITAELLPFDLTELERRALQHEILAMMASRSYRAAGALRALRAGVGQPPSAQMVIDLEVEGLRELRSALVASRSWRWTRWLRGRRAPHPDAR